MVLTRPSSLHCQLARLRGVSLEEGQRKGEGRRGSDRESNRGTARWMIFCHHLATISSGRLTGQVRHLPLGAAPRPR